MIVFDHLIDPLREDYEVILQARVLVQMNYVTGTWIELH